MNIYDFYITPDEYDRAAEIGISRQALTLRVRAFGWDKERAITTPVNKKRETSPWRQTAIDNGISPDTFYARIRLGWDEERAAKTPLLDAQKMAAEARRKYPKELHELREKNGISRATFACRITYSGWDPYRAATEPIWTAKQSSEYGVQKFKEKYGSNPNKELFPKI